MASSDSLSFAVVIPPSPQLEEMRALSERISKMPPRATRIIVRSSRELRWLPHDSRRDAEWHTFGMLAIGIPVVENRRQPHRHAEVHYSNGRTETLVIRAPRSEPSPHDRRGMVRASERRARRAFWARDHVTFKRESAELERRRRALEGGR